MSEEVRSASGLRDRIVSDPKVHDGQQAAIEGTGVPVGFVLAELARGRTQDEIIEWSRPAPGGQRHLSREDIMAAVEYTAGLVQEKELSAPSHAALSLALASPRHPATGLTIDEIKLGAPETLRDIAAGMSVEDIQARRRGVSRALISGALTYAAILARDQRLSSAVPESPSETFLRDVLTPHDRQLVDDLMTFRFVRAVKVSPESLFRDWQHLVAQLESGYQGLYEEYTNDLSVRDVLEDAISLVSPLSQQRVRSAIRPWDERFERVTHLAQEPIFRTVPWRPLRWWWYRLPNRGGDAIIKQYEATRTRYSR